MTYLPNEVVQAERFGIRPGQDSTDGLKALQRWLWAIDYVPTVHFPSGVIEYTYNDWASGLGAGVNLVGRDTILQNNYNATAWSGSRYCFVCRSKGKAGADQIDDRDDSEPTGFLSAINSANVGDSSVTLKTADSGGYLVPGCLVIIRGLDQQGGEGAPPNYFRFEYHRVVSVDPDGVTVNLDGFLKYSYDDTWPALGTNQSGPPVIGRIGNDNDHATEYLRMEGFEFTPNSNDGTDNSQAFFAAVRNVIVNCRGLQVYALRARSHFYSQCHFQSIEVDKDVELFHAEDCTGNLQIDDTNLAIFGTTGCNRVVLKRCTFKQLNGLKCRNAVVDDCDLIKQGSPASPAIRLNESRSIQNLTISNCRFYVPTGKNDAGASDRGTVEVTAYGQYGFTSAATGNGASTIAMNPADFTGQFDTGDLLWTVDGKGGRVQSFTYDAVNDVYLILVDTDDTFSDSTSIRYYNIGEFNFTNNRLVGPDAMYHNLCNHLPRTRRFRNEAFTLKYTNEHIIRGSVATANNYSVVGTVSRLGVKFLYEGTTSGSNLRIHLTNSLGESGEVKIFTGADKEVVFTPGSITGLGGSDVSPVDFENDYIGSFCTTAQIACNDNLPSSKGWTQNNLKSYPQVEITIDAVSI
jgi:hypothetical protein